MSITKMIAILDNLRSIENVGSIFRTADGLGVEKLYLCGTTPRPHTDAPWRRDHLALAKTALGAEKTIAWQHHTNTLSLIKKLKKDGYTILALETAPEAIPLSDVKLPTLKVGIIVGNEVTGIAPEVLKLVDQVIAIPMVGQKESLNVAVAFGVAVFWLLNYH